MNRRRAFSIVFGAIACVMAIARPGTASDHADPMSLALLDIFEVQPNPEANITDLHAFVVGSDGRPYRGNDVLAEGNRLVLSLCVRRALRPGQEKDLDPKKFTFRIHLDLSPPVRFVPETVAVGKTGDELAKAESEILMQRLYGGIITHPDDIVESAALEFEVNLVNKDQDPEVELVSHRAWGFRGPTSFEVVVGRGKQPDPNSIWIATGIFDDPFIFPRFFRRNVVGIVTSIPVRNVFAARSEKKAKPPLGNGEVSQQQASDASGHQAYEKAADRDSASPSEATGAYVNSEPGAPASPSPASSQDESPAPLPILLWATTHDGKRQIDHVGRSLRTQLPRFGYLNDKPPSEHVRAITKVHAEPTIMQAFFGSVVSPLFAHRHYDSVPDVMVYNLREPAMFPNGRALTDDVAQTLAAAGETLLLELAHA